MGRLVSRAMATLVLAAAVSCSDGTGPADTITLLTAGTPLSDVVERGGSKLYAVVVSAGGVYRVSLTGLTDDVDLYAFDDDATFNTPISCLIDHTLFFGTLAEDCAAVATGDTVYLGVSGADALAASVSYTIEVQLQQTTGLTLSAPLEDSVPGGGARFYQAGLTPGSSYTVSVTGLTDSATSFHALESAQGGSQSHDGSPKEFQFTALGSTIYLAVEGTGLQATAVFRLLAAPAPVLTVPVVPTSGPVTFRAPTLGYVETRGSSRYRSVGLPAGNHTISMVGRTGDAQLRVYADSTYSLELDCTLRALDPRECTVSGTTVFFAVESGPLNLDGAGYLLLVW